MKTSSVLALVASICVAEASAVNPYLPLWEFTPDGEPYVFEDPDNPGRYRVYVYGSHDIERTMYCGRDLVVWSASVDSLDTWRYDGVIFTSCADRDGKPLSADGLCDVLYAPDVAARREADGRMAYYLYPNNQAWGRNGMVAKSYRPDGPFEVCNWSEANPTETDGVLRFDPAVFVDDDGRVYGYWGFKHSCAAELDPATMATVRPGTDIVDGLIPSCDDDTLFRFFEASSMRKVKDKYILIYSRVTNNGEWGLPATNYTLAYAYSNSPLGPFTYGGTIIDGRGKERRPDGTYVPTATFYGNTHGSIAQIRDQWYVFYHRQADTTEFSRQAMVAPITVDVTEGADGKVVISEAEYTSEGFEINGLNPLRTYAAGIACYYTHPEPMWQEYPSMIYPGSHSQTVRSVYNGHGDPYSPDINRCPMVNNTDGSVVGYKYFNFSGTRGVKGLKMNLSYVPCGICGSVDIWLDAPEGQKGRRIASFAVKASDPQTEKTISLPVGQLAGLEGKHAIFFAFHADKPRASLCTLLTVGFGE